MENIPPETPLIRWLRGDLIGSGSYSRVYKGTNLESGEQLAVKQVPIPANVASGDRVQAHIRELEEEVDHLKNLSHPNIARYLGRARGEEDALNILMEFVPGESVASLLERSGPFPESVIRMYTKQLLQGLEYLHGNGVMHKGIRGANIFVDDTGCIKLADVGVSGKVFELLYTMTGDYNWRDSMITPLIWKAHEVVRQSGYNFAADIWSVGCTVIEMATGDQPWGQYEKVQAIFLLANSKRPPPIPEHLSEDAMDFLKKCLKLEATLRASVSELREHPFVTV